MSDAVRPSPPRWEDTARKIAALRAREASYRDAAHFAMPHPAGPFRLRQMLPRDAALLYAVANPLFNGRPAARCTLGDIYTFLVVLCLPPVPLGVSPPAARLPRLLIALRLARIRFLSRRPTFGRFLLALDAYIAETFVDCPPSGGEGGGRDSAGGIRPSFLSSMLHLIGRTYHWSREEFHATPLREILLLQKHIIADLQAEAGKKPTGLSAAELALTGEYLNAMEQWQRTVAARN